MQPSKNTPPKEPRLQARVSVDTYNLVQQAADIQGVTLAAFITTIAYEKASQVVKDHDMLVLNAEDSVRFAEALIRPPEPNEALQRAAKRRAKMIE